MAFLIPVAEAAAPEVEAAAIEAEPMIENEGASLFNRLFRHVDNASNTFDQATIKVSNLRNSMNNFKINGLGYREQSRDQDQEPEPEPRGEPEPYEEQDDGGNVSDLELEAAVSQHMAKMNQMESMLQRMQGRFYGSGFGQSFRLPSASQFYQ